MSKRITVAYSTYEWPDYLRISLEAVYDFADQVIVCWGPFKMWREICDHLGLPDRGQESRDIAEAFPDPDGKLRIIDGVFNDFTDSRNTWWPFVDGDWFLSLDTDEFYHPEALLRIRQIIDSLPDQVKRLDGIRREFIRDFWHTYDDDWYPLAGTAAQCKQIKAETGLPLYHRTFQSGGYILMEKGLSYNCVAIKYDPDCMWTPNVWDSHLVRTDGSRYFRGADEVHYTTDFEMYHYGPVLTDDQVLAKLIYHSWLRRPGATIEYLHDYFLNKWGLHRHSHWDPHGAPNRSVKKYQGAHPPVIQRHPLYERYDSYFDDLQDGKIRGTIKRDGGGDQ